MGDVKYAAAPAPASAPAPELDVEQALTELAQAWAAVESARQHAYEYHRLAGAGDARLIRAAHLLRTAGYHDLADAVCHHLIGRGVAEDRWGFEVDETHDDDFHVTLLGLQDRLRDRLPATGARVGPG
jgi:hypothetical protein